MCTAHTRRDWGNPLLKRRYSPSSEYSQLTILGQSDASDTFLPDLHTHMQWPAGCTA